MSRVVRYTVSYKRPGSTKLRTWHAWVPVVGTREEQALEASRQVAAAVCRHLGSEWQEYGISRHEES